jgi:Zn-finger nucleic acid-binding protein
MLVERKMQATLDEVCARLEVTLMQCPRCATTLDSAKLDGIPVETCPSCKGSWLDESELSQLEITVESDPDLRVGMIEWKQAESKLHCPVCGEEMESFDYRDDGVMLDTCKEQHGYWLDAGEGEAVREAMKDRVHDLQRSQAAEVKWGAFIYKVGHPTWIDRLSRMLRG